MLAGIGATPSSWGIFTWSSADPYPWEVVLHEASAAGYDGVELGRYGFFPSDPTQLRGALGQLHLQLVAGLLAGPLGNRSEEEQMFETAEAICSLLASAGGRHLVVLDAVGQPRRTPTAGRSDAAERLDDASWRRLLSTVNGLGELAASHGLSVVVHPHAGTHLEFEDEVERLLADTDEETVGICLDTAHSVYAGIDPVVLFLRHAARVRYVHLKDIDLQKLERTRREELPYDQALKLGVFCRLGAGMFDFGRFASTLDAGGYRGWVTVEQDRLPGSGGTAKGDAQANLAYLHRIGLGGQSVPV